MVEHRAGVDNTNANCLRRCPLPSAADAPTLDWTKGEIMAPAIFLSFMVGLLPSSTEAKGEKDIWSDMEVLRFLQTHQYGSGLSARERDRIYRRAKSYRWMADSVVVLKTIVCLYNDI